MEGVNALGGGKIFVPDMGSHKRVLAIVEDYERMGKDLMQRSWRRDLALWHDQAPVL